MDERLLISAAGAATMLNMSRSFFYSQVACGRIGPKSIAFGRKRLYRTEDLRRWVADGCPPAKD